MAEEEKTPKEACEDAEMKEQEAPKDPAEEIPETEGSEAPGEEKPEEETAEDTPAEENGEEEKSPEEEPENAEAEEKEKKGGFFRRKEKKDKKDEKIAELTDQLTRLMAEFDNFRKRTEKEKAGMYDLGARDVVEKLLPVVDNFERGLAGADESDPFVQGMSMIYKQLMTMLEGIGVKPIDAAGKEFDPNLHNAVMHVDDESLGENVVAQELQKGYMYKDSVVRHSMVTVAN